jgi:shikimate kinase
MSARAHERRIVLTGFMCAGKSTVARALAARLGCAMLDTDAALVAREGRSIAAIIDDEGEPRFRQIERDALRAILTKDGARVVALGGGTWTIAENRALIAAHDCLTVWLDAPFELCWQRIADCGDTRPLARDPERARALYDARRAVYQLATLRIEINEARSAEDAAAEIASVIAQQDFSDEQEGRDEETSNG